MTGQCPQCGQCNTQKASAIYSSGTSHTSGTVYTAGGTTSNGGTYSGGTGTVSATSQTDLARRTEKPFKRIGLIGLVFITTILVFIGFFLCACFSGADYLTSCFAYLNATTGLRWKGLEYLITAVLIISVPWGIRNMIWNATTYPCLYERWIRKWYCHRCDYFFEVC